MALVQPSYGAAPVPATPAPAPAGVRVAAAAPVSRLVQMQARFQKKQMEEKEQKLLRLYESQQQRAYQRVGRGSAGSSTASLSSSTSTLASLGGGGNGGGKVRQLFEERRTNGWDRSYPLEPVTGGKAAARANQPPAYAQHHLPLAVPKTKVTRGASLDRSHGGFQQHAKSTARRSKSHARAEVPAANGHVANGHVANGHNANGHHVNGHHVNGYYDSDPVPHRGKIYHAYEGGNHAYRKTAQDRVNDFNNRNFRRHQEPDEDRDHDDDEEDFPEDEVNYSALGEDSRPSRSQNFAVLQDNKRQEELFAKYQVRELSNRDLLSPPPPELYDDGIDEGTFIYDKTSNVGGPLRGDAPVNNSDRFKTYVSNKHNRGQFKEEIIPRAPHAMATKLQDAKKAPAVRRESASPPTRAVKPAPKKPEPKSPPGSGVSPTSIPSKSGVSPTQQPSSSPISSATKKSASVSRPTSSSVNKNILNSNVKGPANSQKVKNGPAAPAAVRSAPTRDDLTECPICHRRFTNDRITVHKEICAKTSQKKRKEYDATKHRVKGTEAEQFVKRGTKTGFAQKKIEQPKKGDWRKKHEEFIQTIRAAKEAQAHVAAGGKLSDLPPPPPLDTSDYIQCPHCGRKFNEAAAERHIPRCANMQHNKPKPTGKSSAGKRR